MRFRGFILLLLILILVGCANPLNRNTYNKYYRWGAAAEQNENYELAKENYYRALVNARIGNLEPQYHAASSYSLARILGILCDHENAEFLLLEAVKFDAESNGPIHMSYTELAKLKLDQKKYDEAAPYYEKLLSIVDNQEFIDSDPIGFSVIFNEYSQALSQLGRGNDAAQYRKRSEELRKKYPEKKAVAERTPYTINCKN